MQRKTFGQFFSLSFSRRSRKDRGSYLDRRQNHSPQNFPRKILFLKTKRIKLFRLLGSRGCHLFEARPDAKSKTRFFFAAPLISYNAVRKSRSILALARFSTSSLSLRVRILRTTDLHLRIHSSNPNRSLDH